jgi:hypothetical protein
MFDRLKTRRVPGRHRPIRRWPVLLLALSAFVAIWSGWVGLGELTGFGPVQPLPGIADGFTVNTAITLPLGMEAYASYALYVWLNDRVRSARTREFAKWSTFGSLVIGAAGQIGYHLMAAAGITSAPWPVTLVVACMPVAVFGMGAALAHLVSQEIDLADQPEPVVAVEPVTEVAVVPKRRPARRDPARVARAIAMRAEGASYAEIGRALDVSPRTAANYAPASTKTVPDPAPVPVQAAAVPRPVAPARVQPIRPIRPVQQVLPIGVPALGGA